MSSEIDRLILGLNDSSADTRLLMVKKLGVYYDPKLVNPLVKMLNDSDARVREAALFALGAMSEGESIEPIINAMEDEELKVQLAAIKVLGEMRNPKATKPIIKLLGNNEPKLRAAAAIALGQINDKNALIPLIDCLGDKEVSVRQNAILALGQIGDTRAVDPLIAALKDPEIQNVGVLTLGKFKDPRILPPLTQLLTSPNPRVRQGAIVSLSALKSPATIDSILKMLNDEDTYVKRAAAQALSEIKDSTTVDHFITSLSDSNAEIRVTAAKSLGKLLDPKAIKPLIGLLKDSKDTVREEVANSLGDIGDEEALKALQKVMKDPIPVVRIAIVKSIGKLASKYTDQNMMLMRGLSKAEDDSEPLVRSTAAEALGRIYIAIGRLDKAEQSYKKAAKENFSWDYHQNFYEACATGLKCLEMIKKDQPHANTGKLTIIQDFLNTASRMRGGNKFISEYYWIAVNSFNKLLMSKSKDDLATSFQEYGSNLMILSKKLPEDLRVIVNGPQENLTNKFQFISKKALELNLALQEAKLLRPDLFNLGAKILQIEPLDIIENGEQDKAAIMIESMIESVATSDNGMDFQTMKLPSPSVKSYSSTSSKNFEIEEFEIGKAHAMPQKIPVALIQLLKGGKRINIIDEPREIFMRGVDRYFNQDIFKDNKVLQFKKEAINLSVKAKIIGAIDDAMYDGAIVIIFPECSIPNSYIEKLQEYANQFNIYFIAGSDAIVDHGKAYNRAYVIAPNEVMVEQQKNTPTIFPASEKFSTQWIEGIESIKPPVFRVFRSPFGSFIILLGDDFKEYNQYIPFIVREQNLDFVVVMTYCFQTEEMMKKYQSLATEINKPVYFSNSAQFGGSEVFKPKESRTTYGQLKEYTEGIVWNNIELGVTSENLKRYLEQKEREAKETNSS